MEHVAPLFREICLRIVHTRGFDDSNGHPFQLDSLSFHLKHSRTSVPSSRSLSVSKENPCKYQDTVGQRSGFLYTLHPMLVHRSESCVRCRAVHKSCTRCCITLVARTNIASIVDIYAALVCRKRPLQLNIDTGDRQLQAISIDILWIGGRSPSYGIN